MSENNTCLTESLTDNEYTKEDRTKNEVAINKEEITGEFYNAQCQTAEWFMLVETINTQIRICGQT